MAGVTLDLRPFLGRGVLRATTHVGRLSFFVFELGRGLGEWRQWLHPSMRQAQNIGYGSLFIVFITASFAGAVTVLQAGYQLTAGVPIYFAAGIVVSTIILELGLGPVLTALILAGRVGARYAAELGTMRVTEQIDALESLGRSSVSHVLLPRVVAATLMVPVLCIFADFIAILAGWIASKGPMEMSNADFIYGARYFFKPFYMWYSLIKSFFFGLAIAIIPCYVGFNTSHGAEGVGRATTGAVVASSVLILFLNALLARMLLP
jgi:phospholipid/cholesterol/gamma-HCH transport system permease protein